MTTIKTWGLKRIIMKNCIVIKSKTRHNKDSGEISLSSSKLKDRIGEPVKVVVYAKRKK